MLQGYAQGAGKPSSAGEQEVGVAGFYGKGIWSVIAKVFKVREAI